MTDYRLLPGATLAYAGDAVFEILVRRRLIESGETLPGKMSKLSLSYVKATAQSQAVDRLTPHLSEEEQGIYRRGRNAHGISAPKSAHTLEYRRATGLEALFGWLCLSGKVERAGELFDIAFPKTEPMPKNFSDGESEKEEKEEPSA